MSTSRQPQRHLSWAMAAAASLALYAFAIWCEAAYRPARIGFTEVLTWSRMIEALEVTTWSDIEFPIWQWMMVPVEPLGVIGMVGVLAWGMFRLPQAPGAGRVVVWGYSLLLIMAGGWAALSLLLISLPQLPPDGEFLDEGVARASALGVWQIVCLRACWVVRSAGAQRASLARAS